MTEYDVSKLKESEYADWDIFVDKSPQGAIFNKSMWLKNVSSIFGGSFDIIVCLKNNEMVAGCAIYYNKNNILPPIFTPFNGFLYKEETTEITGLLIKYLQENFKEISLIHHPGVKDVSLFMYNNWEVVSRQTYYIPLSKLNIIENGFARDTKRKIKKAEDMGVYVSAVDITEKNIILFYKLWGSSLERQHIAMPTTKDKFMNFIKFLDNNKLCRLYFAYYLDKVISGRLEILTNDVVYDLIAGNDSEYLGTGAGSFLIWNIFKDLSGKYSTFDFVGADVPSVASFKSRFGGQLVSHFMTIKLGRVSKFKTIIKKRLIS